MNRMMQKSFQRRGLLVVLTTLFFFSGLSELLAQETLMVTPKRIVLDAKKRSDVVSLFNNSDDTCSYAVVWEHYRMLENGRYATIDSVVPTDNIADSLIRFYPPEITLAPHSAQVIRLRFLKPLGMLPGEYRSHLTLRGIPRANALDGMRRDSTMKGTRVRIHPIWGAAIPVIVRQESTPPIVSMDSLVVLPTDSTTHLYVSFNLLRSGVESSYGAVAISFVERSGKVTLLSKIRNVAVYPPLEKREVGLNVRLPEGLLPTNGTIRVEYQTDTGAPTEHVLASMEVSARRVVN